MGHGPEKNSPQLAPMPSFKFLGKERSGGIVHDGNLMFDLHSFPSRPKSVKGKPYTAILEKGFSDSIYGRSKGGNIIWI